MADTLDGLVVAATGGVVVGLVVGAGGVGVVVGVGVVAVTWASVVLSVVTTVEKRQGKLKCETDILI